jgi:hypothetical protein
MTGRFESQGISGVVDEPSLSETSMSDNEGENFFDPTLFNNSVVEDLSQNENDEEVVDG